ncbi:MAG: sulfite exporter TauE/SafE family protein [Anaerolineae bacterium]|nr:sulfite exporter TauE/SafE family protein [Gemmatimonadaceae bacterium]
MVGIQEIALLALLGLVVGTYGTLVGLGGGFLIVPLLLLIYKLPPPVAAATSLFVVFINAASGSAGYLRRRRVDVGTALILALATVPGAFIGPWIGERIPERVFKLVFGIFLLGMAAFLIARPEGKPQSIESRGPGFGRVRRVFRDAEGSSFEYTYSLPLALGISFLVGIFASLLGIGGGLIHVPAMIHLMGFPVHIATATSTLVLAITAGAGTVEYARRDYIDWGLAAAIGIGVVVGAQLGAGVAHRLKGRRIVRLMTVAVVVLGVRLLWSI